MTKLATRNDAGETAAKKPAAKKPPTKHNQLKRLLTKPGGVRASVLGKRLGWQPHTIRAAISGLRKSGHTIVRKPSKSTGESIYWLQSDTKEASSSTNNKNGAS